MAKIRTVSEVLAENRAAVDAEKWESRRWQAAVAAMQGMLSNPTNAGSCEEYSLDAVDHADALIAEYRKQEKSDAR